MQNEVKVGRLCWSDATQEICTTEIAIIVSLLVRKTVESHQIASVHRNYNISDTLNVI